MAKTRRKPRRNSRRKTRRNQKVKKRCDISSFQVLSQKDVNVLYRITEKTVRLLDKHRIDYWAEGGTLIGLMRTTPGGFISWDDDVDISMDLKDKPRLLKLRSHFKRAGLEMKSVGRYTKIYKPSNTRVWIDVFYLNEGTYPQKHYQKYNYIRNDVSGEDELYPLRKRSYGPFTMKVANKAHQYLDRCYPGWKTTAYLYNHHTKGKQKISFKDCPELKKPKLPTNY